jgi:mono/diheme cytochrome c family protein
MKYTLLSAFIAFIVAAASVTGVSQTPASSTAAVGAPSAALLTQYCVTCHNARAKAGGLTLDPAELAQIDRHAEIWEKVIRKLQTGMMPPSGAPRPGRPAVDGFVTALQAQIDRAAAAKPFAGTPALHRLNRAEYSNAIRDLLALDVDAASLLPPDDSAAGFDNIADVLGVSPALIEGYATAAAKISRLSVGDPSLGLDRVTYRAAGNLSQEDHLDGLPLGTRGGMIVRHTFPLNADYDLQIGPGRSGGIGAGRHRASAGHRRHDRRSAGRLAGQDASPSAGGGRSAHPRGRARQEIPRRWSGWRVRRAHAGTGYLADHDCRSLQRPRARRHAKPASAVCLHAEGGNGGGRLRREDPEHAGDPRISTAGAAVWPRHGHVARVLPDRA